MFNRLRGVSSIPQLQNHLAKKGGSSKGLFWGEGIDIGLDGEQSDEYSVAIEGSYFLNNNPEIGSGIEFAPGDAEESRTIVISKDDVLRGAVKVIARRRKI